TGMRRMEMLTLRWADVDLVKGMVGLKVTKTKRRRVVPMPQMTQIVLEEWKQHQRPPSDLVFPSRDGLKPASMVRAWSLACVFHPKAPPRSTRKLPLIP